MSFIGLTSSWCLEKWVKFWNGSFPLYFGIRKKFNCRL